MKFPMSTPIFELLVLAMLSKGDTYGYQICKTIKQISGADHSCLYSILKKLEKQSFLISYSRPHQGGIRKYYGITERGLQRYNELSKAWDSYVNMVNQVINGKFS